MSPRSRRDLALAFDSAAAGYQDARPDYPDELYADLISGAGLRAGDQLVEIGSGPGKATLPLARRGFRITALEPGPGLADEARRRLSGTATSVITTTFEDWQPDHSEYALVYAATAWHWVDPEVRWSKVAAVLADGGHLAVFGSGHAFPEGFDPFFTEIQQTYNELGEGIEVGWPPPRPDQLPDPSPEYRAAGFGVDAVHRYVWSLTYDADSYIALLNTFSGHILMAPEKRDRLFAEVRKLLAERPDGLLTRHWVATLVIAHPES
ncbi:MAG: methyltransferase domain-containing protein [Microlunatus sp.]|nr:methyltransferase domain-containing protein [Microlunatus sp.]